MNADTPLESFQRATALAIKALGRRAELEVAFTGDAESDVEDSRVKIPSPDRNLPAGDVALTRGAADAAALRLLYHDPKLHDRLLPADAAPRAVFEALEQARCEALGMRRFAGVGRNISSLLENRCLRKNLQNARGQAEAPLSEVLHLLAHEALSGQKIPSTGLAAVNAWRPFIESKIGAHLGRLPEVLDDQAAFAAETQKILTALNLKGSGEDAPEEGREKPADGRRFSIVVRRPVEGSDSMGRKA